MASEELRAGFADESQGGATEEGEDLCDFGLAVAATILAPLRVAFPVVLVLDAPVLANDVGKLARSGLRRVAAAHKMAHAGPGFGAGTGALHGACDADDRTGKGQPDGFSFHRSDSDFVARQPAVALFIEAKRGASRARTLRAWRAAAGWLSLSETR